MGSRALVVNMVDVDSTSTEWRESKWHHSTFPHPLITVDRDADGVAYKIVAVGEAAQWLKLAVSAAVHDFIHDASTASIPGGDS